MIIPAILSLLFSLGLILLAVFLCFAALSGRTRKASDIDTYIGPVAANRWLSVMRFIFVALAIGVIGFHAYWAFFTAGPLSVDNDYVTLRNSRDQRNRRLQEAGLRGWVFDRKDDVNSALIRYRLEGNTIVRDYPLAEAGAHIVGYKDLLRGEAGIEKAYNDLLTTPTSTYNALVSTVPVGKDLVTTIDSDLQRTASTLLSGKRAAAVVIDAKTGGILAMASSPTFSPKELSIEDVWQKISTDEMNKPLVNRATNQYYLPGSSLKTVIAAAALTAGLDHLEFTCSAGGFTPPGSGRAINDDSRSVHGRVNFQRAFEVSCNQYFAQLGLKLGAARIAETAGLFGIHIDQSPEESRKTIIDNKLWNSESTALAATLGPNKSRMLVHPKIFSFDLAIQSIGQGYTQMTPFQMALIASAAANNGQIMQPRLEQQREPKLLSTAISPDIAARLRKLMIGVVQHGTAANAFAGSLVSAGGKTGTAERQVVVYDPKTGKPLTYTDKEGKKHVKTELSIDAWFIGFAPAENPQVAFAVMVENGGHGGAVAAPIARKLVERCAELGLINFQPQPQQRQLNAQR